MKFRLGLILSIFLLVVIPILATGLVSMETAGKALQIQAEQAGIPLPAQNLAINRLRESIVYLLIIGTVSSLTGAGLFASGLAGSIQTIHRGLASLAHDRTAKLPHLRGVMGEIASAVNRMAAALIESEEQVLRTSRLAALGELSAGIAHEIRNPLTSVKGYAQLLAEELPEEDEKQEYTRIIEREVIRMERIVQGLLAFAHPSSSQFQPVDLDQVLDETLILVNFPSFRQHLEFRRAFEPNIMLEADREQIKQIILNLIINATQAMPDKGTITVTTWRDTDSAFIRVSDTGPGVLPEHLDKLFNPFFTTKEKGTGLGLSIVHRLIELHHGQIQVNSTPGIGTEFTIQLPLSQGGLKDEDYLSRR